MGRRVIDELILWVLIIASVGCGMAAFYGGVGLLIGASTYAVRWVEDDILRIPKDCYHKPSLGCYTPPSQLPKFERR